MDESLPHPLPEKKSKKFVVPFVVALSIAFVGAIAWYWTVQRQFVYSDKAVISAPLIELTPFNPGILKRVLIREGDTLTAHQAVAYVGTEIITTEVSGMAMLVKNDIGAQYHSGEAVVTMIEPKEMRLVARIEENKGLKDIWVGQKAFFTVDAYGSQEFEGVVESVSQTSHEGDVVFNISDKRETKEFEVKVKYDLMTSPAFRQGMSAEVWIKK